MVLVQNGITLVGIIKDLAMLSENEWKYLIKVVNKVFEEVQLSEVFYKNNIPIPRVGYSCKLIREYHESAVSVHKGMTKTYNL